MNGYIVIMNINMYKVLLLISVIPTLKGQGQEDHCEFRTHLDPIKMSGSARAVW